MTDQTGFQPPPPPPRAPLQVVFADGRRFDVVNTSVADFLLHPVFIKFNVCCVLIFALLDRGAVDIGTLTGLQSALMWGFVLAMSFLLYAVFLGCVRALWAIGLLRRLFTPLLTGCLLLVSTAPRHALIFVYDAPMVLSFADIALEFFRDMMVFIVLDVMFSGFVASQHPSLRAASPRRAEPERATAFVGTTAEPPAPAVGTPAALSDGAVPPDSGPTAPAAGTAAAAADLRGAPDAAADPQGPSAAGPGVVHFGSTAVDLDTLVYLRAEDHYLRIVTRDRRLLIRFPLGDAIAALDPEHGLQISRSTWVAFEAILDLRQEPGGRLVARLSNGEEEQVTRSRRIALQSALSRRGR